MSITTALTPFANDTFAFAGLAQGYTPSPLCYSFDFQDIEVLNQRALRCDGDLVKVSFSCLGRLFDDYTLLPVGSCLIQEAGPKIFAKSPFALLDLDKKRLGIPGYETTAYLLLRLFAPQAKEEHIYPYHELLKALEAGEIDCALLIHDTGRELQARGFHEIADMLALWFAKTGCPLPLGGLVAKRELGTSILQRLYLDVLASLRFAHENPDIAINYALSHSLGREWEWVEKNIASYVSRETFGLSPQGVKAIATLIEFGHKAGILPAPPNDWLFNPH